MNLFITILMMEILVNTEMDLFIPSFPELQNVFKLSTFKVEFLLSINLIAHCISSLMMGNLGDKYGRKIIIIIGLTIFIVGDIICILSVNYHMLLLGRFLQGIGVSSIAVLGYVVIADLYSIQLQQKIIGIFNGIISLSMALAPILGSYINLLLNWHGNFIILFIFGLLCLISSILFLPKNKKNINSTMSLKEYKIIFKTKKTFYCITTLLMLFQSYWIFIAIAPILYMQDLGVSIKEFGFYQGSSAITFAIASFSNTYLIKKFGQKKCFYSSIIALVSFIIFSIILITYKINNPLIITLITQLVCIGSIFPYNILWPITLESIPNSKAKITALFISGRLIITVICLQLVSYFYQGTFKSLAIVMCTTIIITLFMCYKLLQENKIFD